MKKTLFVGLLVAAIMALSFTGCKNNANGTAPVLTEYFITYNDAEITANTLDSLTRLHTLKFYDSNTSAADITTKYQEVLDFYDPDLDVDSVEFSLTSTFNVLWGDPYPISQIYADQISSWKNTSFTSQNNNDLTIYIRLKDRNGNYSNVKSYVIHKTFD